MPIIFFNWASQKPKKVRRAAAIIMNEAIKAKRVALAAISRSIKLLVKEGAYDSVNEGLIDQYSDGEDLDFNTFKQWKEKGFSIKKGSKAFLVWGKPRKAAVPEPKDGEDDEFKFWPLCYLFSNKQVEKKEEKEVAL